MDEYKTPKKPFVTFWTIAMILLILLNLVALPMIESVSIVEVDYGTFMSMTEEGTIAEVQIQDNQILFTSTNEEDTNVIYQTGLMDDPNLVERL